MEESSSSSSNAGDMEKKRAHVKKYMEALLIGDEKAESMDVTSHSLLNALEVNNENRDSSDSSDSDETMNDSEGSYMEDSDFEYSDDNELTNMLESTKEMRKHLKTGDASETLAEGMDEFTDNLIATSGIGKLRPGAKRRLAAGEKRIPEEAKQLLGEANSLYIAKDYGKAIDMLQEIITKFSNVHQAWNTLGLVHEEMGNHDRSLQLRMVAAHMCGIDAQLWKELALKSIEHDAMQQGLYCLSKALVIDPMDVDVLWDKAYLYKQLKQYDEALDGFQQILAILPNHFKVINELAQLLRIKGKTREAIELYETAIENVTRNGGAYDEDEDEGEGEGEDDEFSDKLGFAEINMLSELYLILNDYRRAIDCIKTGVRHVQSRQDEMWWQDRINDDDEYFGEEEEDNVPDRLDLPIELRVRMGICRVYLGQPKIANRHFKYLLKYPPTMYPDLQQDIAYAYFDKRYYEQALEVFQRVIGASDQVEVDVLIRAADCYREMGELDTAAVFYTSVLEEQAENFEVLMSLAQVYEEQGKEGEALSLVHFVLKKKREARQQEIETKQKEREEHVKAQAKARAVAQSESESEEQVLEAPESSETNAKNKHLAAPRKQKPKLGVLMQPSSIFSEDKEPSIAEKRRHRKAEIQRKHEETLEQVRVLFDKTDEIEKIANPCVLKMERPLMREYMRVAKELWIEFSEMKILYNNKYRGRMAQGFHTARNKKASKENPNLEAHKMADRLQAAMASKKKREERSTEDGMEEDPVYEMDEEDRELRERLEREEEITQANDFYGFSYEKWINVFVRYAYMLTLTRCGDDATEMLKHICEANKVWKYRQRVTLVRLAMLGCSLISDNEPAAYDVMKWFFNYYQFRSDVYCIFVISTPCGGNNSDKYANYAVMRFLIRSVRLMDALVATHLYESGEDISQESKTEMNQLHEALVNIDHYISLDDKDYPRHYNLPSRLQDLPTHTGADYTLVEPIPRLLTVFGTMMSISKNYISAIMFFLRSYAVEPKDALNVLLLGINLVQRALQRKTDNRHFQILQGMVFMEEYCQIRDRPQEVAYNMGRIFHLLGLTHLAVPHYERALCTPSFKYQDTMAMTSIDDVYEWPSPDEYYVDDDETDLRREAAYNLYNIYVTSGNVALAQIVLMKYCSI
ncbi:hypothetical protein BDF14DRAFT_1776688 [Spinellus fusiger]|nr:hypothetical protein BDF14DRAFT_1776688 [Spinellus fusiger]